MSSNFDNKFNEVKAKYEARMDDIKTRYDAKEITLEEYTRLSDENMELFETERAEALKNDPLRQLRNKAFGKKD